MKPDTKNLGQYKLITPETNPDMFRDPALKALTIAEASAATQKLFQWAVTGVSIQSRIHNPLRWHYVLRQPLLRFASPAEMAIFSPSLLYKYKLYLCNGSGLVVTISDGPKHFK
jgi:hypothetical protein